MQFMKHLMAAAALTVAGSAMAVTTSTTYTAPAALSASAPYSLTYLVGFTGAGTFSDIINFTVASNVSAQVNVAPATFAIGQTSGLSVSVFSGSTALTLANGVYTLLAGTAYSFHVNGTTGGLGGYSVNYYLTPTPTPAVPEASSVAMAVAGLGMVGLIAVRRRRV